MKKLNQFREFRVDQFLAYLKENEASLRLVAINPWLKFDKDIEPEKRQHLGFKYKVMILADDPEFENQSKTFDIKCQQKYKIPTMAAVTFNTDDVIKASVFGDYSDSLSLEVSALHSAKSNGDK